MAKPPNEDLETFLRRQDAGDLVTVLLELAKDHEAVQARLARMQLADRPDKLAAGFKKTLSGWRRSTKFYGYREAGQFGRHLDGWLDQVARELLPKDPPASLALFEAFIEADAAWFDRADDSDGVIGDAVRAACRHWLQAAARCETPPDVWPERLLKLYQADQYGARDELLRQANLLLDEPAQRGLVARLETQLSKALEASPGAKSPSMEVFRISGALSLLSESLRDPDVKVRASLRYSPNPNPVQRQAFVRAYLDADRPTDALAWLQDPCPQAQPVVLAAAVAVEAGGGQHLEFRRAVDGAASHLRADDADLVGVAVAVGVPNFFGCHQQGDELAAQEAVVGRDCAADADIGDLAGQAGLANFQNGCADRTQSVRMVQQGFEQGPAALCPVWRSEYDVAVYTLQEGIIPKDHAMFEQYWIDQFAGLLNVAGNKPGTRHSGVAKQVIAAIQHQLERARKGEQD